MALAWAGFGDPKRAPPELVTVLGETRIRLLDVPSWPVFSPDGKLLAVGVGNQVMLFDVATGQYLRSFVGHAGRCGVYFHPGGRMLASTGDDRTIKFWDVDTGREIRTLCGHTDAPQSLAFSPDGQTLASAGKDASVRLWRVDTGEPLRVIRSPCTVWTLAFQPAGTLLAAGGDDGAVRIWDAADGAFKYEGRRGQPGRTQVAFRPDGKALASGNGSEVIVHDAVTFRELNTILAPADGLLAFAPDGRSLLTGRHYQAAGVVPAVRRWELDTGKELPAYTLPDEQGWVHYVLSPDGKTLAAASYDQRVMRLYDAATGRPRFPAAPGHTSAAVGVVFSPDGTTVASCGGDGNVILWDAATSKKRLMLAGRRRAVDVAFSPDGKVLATGGADGKVFLWDAALGRLLNTLIGPEGAVDQIAFSPDGLLLAAASWDKAVYLWDAAGGRRLKTLRGHANPVHALAFSPDGRTLASGDQGGELKLWDAASGQETLGRTFPAPIGRAAFLEDGKILAITQWTNGSVALLSGDSGAWLRTLTTPSLDETLGISARAGGRMLAVTGRDGAVRLWDLTADPPAGQVWRLPPYTTVASVAFSPEGRYLAAAGADGVVRILRAPEHVRPDPPPPAVPFRLLLNGLAGKHSLDATAFPPPWRKEGVFAAVNGPGEATFPSVPATRYVLDVELEVPRLNGGALHLQTGDLDISLESGDRQETVRCHLNYRYAGVQWFAGQRSFGLGELLRLKLVATGMRAFLLCDNVPILSSDYKPMDLAFRIRAEGGAAATVYRCSCRPLEDDDLRGLGWPLAPAGPILDPAGAARRLKALTAGLDDKPAEGKRFASGAGAMAWVAPGEFGLGSDGPGAPACAPKHPVRLTKGFWIGQYLVTQGEWAALMPANPSRFQGSPYLPVDAVRWEDAMRYCRLLTDSEKAAGRVPEGYEYRLPTEAEWEYAGRAGTAEDAAAAADLNWYDLTSTQQSHEVGGMPPNRWGLYDMQGNVRQWCLDAWYTYPKPGAGAVDNPVHFGDPAKDEFVIRGGAWWSPKPPNAIFRRDMITSDKAVGVGFRVVLGPVLRRD